MNDKKMNSECKVEDAKIKPKNTLVDFFKRI